jgi:hypothetical protein
MDEDAYRCQELGCDAVVNCTGLGAKLCNGLTSSSGERHSAEFDQRLMKKSGRPKTVYMGRNKHDAVIMSRKSL